MLCAEAVSYTHLDVYKRQELEQEADTLSHAEEIKAGLYRVGQTLYSDHSVRSGFNDRSGCSEYR